MLQRDLIMREIEQAIRVLLHVLAQTLRLKSEERYEEALAYIRKAFGEADLSPRPVSELSPAELVALCRYPRGFEHGLALAIADLLCEEADVLARMGALPESRARAAGASALYEAALATEGAALPIDIAQKLARAERLAAGRALP